MGGAPPAGAGRTWCTDRPATRMMSGIAPHTGRSGPVDDATTVIWNDRSVCSPSASVARNVYVPVGTAPEGVPVRRTRPASKPTPFGRVSTMECVTGAFPDTALGSTPDPPTAVPCINRMSGPCWSTKYGCTLAFAAATWIWNVSSMTSPVPSDPSSVNAPLNGLPAGVPPIDGEPSGVVGALKVRPAGSAGRIE